MKNHLSEEQIRTLVSAAFPGRSMECAEALTAGLCNALYRIRLDDGFECVLKVAAADMTGMMANEKWLMQTEIAAMRLMREKIPGVPVPQVLFSDESGKLCSGAYFFMEYVQGDMMRSLREGFTAEESRWYYGELGRCVREIAQVHGEKFGLVGTPVQFDTLHGLMRFLIGLALEDLERHGDRNVDGLAILARLDAEKALFDAVTQPELVHFDLWENNVILHDGRIAGIIDWERALWGEMLMEERFRSYCRNEDFYAGVGLGQLTQAQQRRSWWYDMLFYLQQLAAAHCHGYGQSEYDWALGLLQEAWRAIEGESRQA